MTRRYPDLGYASVLSCREGNLLQPIRSTGYLNLVSDTSSLCNFCMGSRFTDAISRETGGSVGEMSAVFSLTRPQSSLIISIWRGRLERV